MEGAEDEFGGGHLREVVLELLRPRGGWGGQLGGGVRHAGGLAEEVLKARDDGAGWGRYGGGDDGWRIDGR